MNLLGLLGKLPSSDSAAGTLNALDLQKTLRMWIVTLAATFLVTFGGSVAAVCNVNTCDLSGGLHTLIGSALASAGTATVAAIGELVRRYIAGSRPSA